MIGVRDSFFIAYKDAALAL